MQFMQAAVCREFGAPLEIEQVAIDEPRHGEVKIKLTACAICHSDILYMDGAWGGHLPTVFGHEGAGIVESCGSGITDIQAGDPVVASLLRSCGTCYFCQRSQSCLCQGVFQTDEPGRLQDSAGATIYRGLRCGFFAQYAIVHQSQAVKVPSQMNTASAALLACGVITGYGSVTRIASVTEGEHTVVIGVGGVGINCVQAARISGAATVTAIDVNTDRLEAAKRFGATDTINPVQTNSIQAVRAMTSGRGADHVFVATGRPAAVHDVFQLARPGGAVVLAGMPAEGEQMSFETLDFIDASQKLLGSKMGNSNLKTDIPKLVDLHQCGSLELDELVTGLYPLEQINDAIQATRQGQGLRNVIRL